MSWRITFGEIDINDIPRLFVVEDGWDAETEGQLILRLRVKAATPDGLVEITKSLEATLDAAARAIALDIDDWIAVEIARGTTGLARYIITGGEFIPGPLDAGSAAQIVTLRLDCLSEPFGEAYTVDIAGEYGIGSAPALIPAVRGTRPALARIELTPSEAIGRVRIATRSGKDLEASDWTPWRDTLNDGGSIIPDAEAYGGSYARRQVSGTSWLSMATASVPAGPYNRGPVGIWARVRDKALAMAAPSSMTAAATPGQASISSRTVTPDTPVVTETTETTYSTPNIRQERTDSVTGATGSTQAVAASWSPTTVDGNTWQAWIHVRQTGGPTTNATYDVTAVPSGWTVLENAQYDAGSSSGDVLLACAIREDAPASSGSMSFTVTRSTGTTTYDVTLWMVEIENVPESSRELFNIGPHDANPSVSSSSRFPNTLVTAATAASGGTPGTFFGGFSVEDTTLGRKTASLLMEASGGVQFSVTQVGAGVSGMIGFRPIVTETVTETSAPSSNPPGRLNPGSYVIYVQAIDEDGNYGLASAVVANSTATVTVANSSAAWGWGAVSGAEQYRVVIAHQGIYYEFFVPTNSFTLTELPPVSQGTGRAPGSMSVTPRLQAIDASNGLSNAASASAVTVSSENGAVTINATAPSGTVVGYLVTLQIGSTFRAFRTPDATLPYTIRDLTRGTIVSALPATTGAVASRNSLRMVIGTHEFAAVQIERVEDIGSWVHVYLGTTARVHRMVDGSSLALPVRIQGLSGGGPASDLEVDMVWAAPHDEPQLTLRTPDLSGLAGVWVAEAYRRGTRTLAHQESSGSPANELSAPGLLELAPRDVLLSPLPELADGVSSLDPTVEISGLTIYPRMTWAEGDDV